MKKAVSELRKKNNELDKKLTEINASIMTDIIVYLRVGNITEAQVESVRQDLLDMVLTAQDRGDDISSIIGKDYQSFADAILQSATPKTFAERAAEMSVITIRCFYILLAINVILSSATIVRKLIDKQPYNLRLPISLDFLFGVVVIVTAAYLIVLYVGKKSFKLTIAANEQKQQPKQISYPKRFLWGALLGLLFMAFVLMKVKLSAIVLFNIHIVVLIAVIIVLFLIDKLFLSRI